MTNRSKSSLFLMEMIIVLTIFAICVAVCVNIIAASHIMTSEASDTRNALMVAESAAEGFKIFAGDSERLAEVVGGFFYSGLNTVSAYYDSNWQIADSAGAAYAMRLTMRDGEISLVFADITVSNLLTGAEIIGFTAATRVPPNERGVN